MARVGTEHRVPNETENHRRKAPTEKTHQPEPGRTVPDTRGTHESSEATEPNVTSGLHYGSNDNRSRLQDKPPHDISNDDSGAP